MYIYATLSMSVLYTAFFRDLDDLQTVSVEAEYVFMQLLIKAP